MTTRIESLGSLENFLVIDESNTAYRTRIEFAEQLIPMVHLFDEVKVNQFFSGFALAFSADRIAGVRCKGVLLLAEVLGILMRAEWPEFEKKVDLSDTISHLLPLTVRIAQEIRNGFWNNRNWQHRQSFGRLLTIILGKKLFTDTQFCFVFFR